MGDDLAATNVADMILVCSRRNFIIVACFVARLGNEGSHSDLEAPATWPIELSCSWLASELTFIGEVSEQIGILT